MAAPAFFRCSACSCCIILHLPAGLTTTETLYACHEWTPAEQTSLNNGQSTNAVCTASGLTPNPGSDLFDCLTCGCCAIASELLGVMRMAVFSGRGRDSNAMGGSSKEHVSCSSHVLRCILSLSTCHMRPSREDHLNTLLRLAPLMCGAGAVAVAGPASQVTTNEAADRALDGSAGTCARTTSRANPWWWVSC